MTIRKKNMDKPEVSLIRSKHRSTSAMTEVKKNFDAIGGMSKPGIESTKRFACKLRDKKKVWWQRKLS